MVNCLFSKSINSLLANLSIVTVLSSSSNMFKILVVEDNKEFTKYLLQGVPVEVKTNTGYQYKNVKLIDFDNVLSYLLE